MKFKHFLSAFLLFIFATLSNSQMLPEEVEPEVSSDSLTIQQKVTDTIYFHYEFHPGDTLVYVVHTNDSLIHNFDEPIKKQREEKIMITCDSVDSIGNFHLIYQTLSLLQKEWKDSKDTVERTSSPWIGRKMKLVIDSLGNRLQSISLDSMHIAASLGGSFQPYLFFPIQNSSSELGKSWLVQSSDTLVENAFPPAKITQTSLFRAKEKIIIPQDTVSFISFVKTAKGIYGFQTNDISVSVQNVMNIYGELQISLKFFVPSVYFVTQEEKLLFIMDDGSKIPAWHYSTTTFELQTLSRFSENQNKKEKNKNNKKK
ncbi:MAG: hypothetical protein A2X64_08225 [Ignavibacteria bacterium GWF2_33_9]|nr:MAG: hypothetical protein A2X64_08225 [Ignavibacteria bacterium GWF2_33_9]